VTSPRRRCICARMGKTGSPSFACGLMLVFRWNSTD